MLVIEFFHLKKFLVCDLKPDNIKITEDKTVVFIDLDHAISQDDLLQFEYHSNDFPTDFVCSEFNSDYFSNESDIVSLGNLIYFIMNGENPKNNDFIHINRSNKYNIYLAQIYNMCIKENKKNRPSISKLINLLFLSFPNIIENNNIKYLVEINAQIIREMNNINENDEYLKKCINSVEIRCINNKNDLSRMIEYYSKNINKEDQNNSEEMIILGLIHLNDIIIKQNINEALRNIEQAAKLNNQTAQVVVHNLYTNEIVIEKNINKALKYLSYAANNGNSIAQELMGNYYLEGKYIEQNIPKSLHYFSCSANQNNFISQKIMAIFYINGKYIKRDLNKAIAYLKLSADQNDSEAKLILACFFKKTETYETETYETYFSNFCNMLNMDFSSINFKEQIEIFISIPKNDQVSIQYLNDATNQCLKEAQFLYGLMDIENNFDKSMHYLKLSADQNYSPAQYLLGNIYYSKTPKEVDNAVCYFKLASNQGHTDAQLCLGLIILIEKNDIKEGIKYIEMAAKKNNSIAQCLIGLYYTQFNVDQNDIIILQKLEYVNSGIMLMMCNDNINNELGIRYLTSSAKQNNELAQIFLGIIYSSNPFFVKDFDKSLYYFHLASKKNSEAKIIYDLLDVKNDAKKNIVTIKYSEKYPIFCYLYGMIQHNNGNIDKSINYFMQAAIYDIPDAQLQLALFYQNEKKDMKNAIFYYIKAAFNNEKSAQYIIGIYSIYGLYVNKNYDVGITFLTRSAQNKYQKAYFALGFLYQEGKCVKRDIKKSIEYYIDGSNVYDAYSQNNLGIIYKYGFEKQINKDISRSNHFFQKGYKDKKNALCMINLAKNYIYYDENIDTSIKLLIHVSNKCRSYKHKTKNNLKCISISRKLLSFALIRKYGNDIAYVMKQFKLNYDCVSDELVNDLHYNIVIEQLDNKFIFKEKYESYRDVDFVYNLNKRIISLNELMDSETEKNKLLNLKKDIDEHFYEGFGC